MKRKISGQFTPHTAAMLRSPAWCALSLSARRLLDRLELEHMNHRGHDNGDLPVTHAQFCDYGIHHHAVTPAQREAVALGFCQITERGHAGHAGHGAPNKFRLTYLPTNNAPATNDCTRIETIEDAIAISIAARKNKQKQRRNSHCRKTRFPTAGFRQ